jgi:hypothetical protein
MHGIAGPRRPNSPSGGDLPSVANSLTAFSGTSSAAASAPAPRREHRGNRCYPEHN